MADDLAPAIDYARNGFPVTELVAKYWKGNIAAFEKNKALIEELDNARHTYLIRRQDPARTGRDLQEPRPRQHADEIADGRPRRVLQRRIAHTIDAYFKRIGGDLRYADFAEFHGEWVTPESVNYRGYDVYELPPNGQGAAVLEMLQILKHFDLKKMGAGSADALTAMLEAKRLAYEDLAKYYADPRFRACADEGPDVGCLCRRAREGDRSRPRQSEYRPRRSQLLQRRHHLSRPPPTRTA